jgi:hypothetical protein
LVDQSVQYVNCNPFDPDVYRNCIDVSKYVAADRVGYEVLCIADILFVRFDFSGHSVSAEVASYNRQFPGVLVRLLEILLQAKAF